MTKTTVSDGMDAPRDGIDGTECFAQLDTLPGPNS